MDYPIKHVFAVDAIVIGFVTVWSPDATASGPPGSTEYVVPGDATVGIGWVVSGTVDAPVFTAP